MAIERNVLNLIKGTYKKPYIGLDDERPNDFPEIKNKPRMFTLLLLFSITLKDLV